MNAKSKHTKRVSTVYVPKSLELDATQKENRMNLLFELLDGYCNRFAVVTVGWSTDNTGFNDM